MRYFPVVPRIDIPNRMNGRRAELVSMILSDLEKLDEHYALKIDLGQVGETKANLRSALHREAQKRQINLNTRSDEKH